MECGRERPHEGIYAAIREKEAKCIEEKYEKLAEREVAKVNLTSLEETLANKRKSTMT